jgi:transposase
LVLACTLMALLPKLGTMSRKQVAALVGVAPYAFESGKFKGRRCIWGGRAPVRETLYMTAMSVGNWNPVLKAFRNRLKDTGKMPKVVTSLKGPAEYLSMMTPLLAIAPDAGEFARSMRAWDGSGGLCR